MTSVILRHCPDLAAVLPRSASAFAPWRPVIARAAGPDAGRGRRGKGSTMTNLTTKLGHAGLDALAERPLLTSIWRRRTHRVSRGSSIEAGSMSWTSSEPRTPLTELEEAVLISLTGCTGLTMPDRPFADPRDHKPIMAKPNLNMAGRTAGSPDNAQGTHFFMINDTGTYFLRKLPPSEDATASVFDPGDPARAGRRGEGPAARPPHRRARREPGLPRLPRLQPVPVQPARAPRSCSRSWTCPGSTSTG